MIETFAKVYYYLTTHLKHDVACHVNFTCRGLKIGREISPAKLTIGMTANGLSFFSSQTHRVTPIRFTLAELCWILAGRSDVESLASYNRSMMHYSHEGIITGSYGMRLRAQLPRLIERLKDDIYTRQACASIFWATDCVNELTHIPCNAFLQFLCRPPLIDLHVTSRSSDFVTGLSIDSIHWQALLILMANELKASGFDVIPSILHYSIASLHVYDVDVEMINNWQVLRYQNEMYEHYIPLVISLSNAIKNAKSFFEKDLTLIQLMEILEIETIHLPRLQMLDELFQRYKNKVVR